METANGKAKTRRPVKVRRVDECSTLDEIFTNCLPAFGGAYLRRIYTILDQAIGMGCPLTVSISGPVTVSGQRVDYRAGEVVIKQGDGGDYFYVVVKGICQVARETPLWEAWFRERFPMPAEAGTSG